MIINFLFMIERSDQDEMFLPATFLTRWLCSRTAVLQRELECFLPLEVLRSKKLLFHYRLLSAIGCEEKILRNKALLSLSSYPR